MFSASYMMYLAVQRVMGLLLLKHGGLDSECFWCGSIIHWNRFQYTIKTRHHLQIRIRKHSKRFVQRNPPNLSYSFLPSMANCSVTFFVELLDVVVN